MRKTLIIPGIHGSGPGHWQDWWLHDREEAQLVEQEDWSRPVLEDWLHALERHVMANPGAVLVAHSLGCVLVAHLAGRLAAGSVGGALLVAPCELAITRWRHTGIAGFDGMPERTFPFPSMVVGSRNDPYMGYEITKLRAIQWGSVFVDLGNAGHINPASGFGRWPQAYVLGAGLKDIANAPPEAFHDPHARRWRTPIGPAPVPAALPDGAGWRPGET